MLTGTESQIFKLIGGIYKWTKGWEFYYYSYRNGTPVHRDGMENVLFGRSRLLRRCMSPTSNTFTVMPDLRQLKSVRPFKRSFVEGFYFGGLWLILRRVLAELFGMSLH